MSILTWYCANPEQSGSSAGLLTLTQPGASTSTTGWIVPSGESGTYSRMSFRQEKANTTFAYDPVQPDSGPLGLGQDCWRISDATTGDFSAGTWYSSLSVIGVTAGGIQDGRARFRLWRSSNADGTSATEVTAGAMIGTAITNLSTTVAQSSSASTQIGAFSLANEYLFMQTVWETSNTTITFDTFSSVAAGTSTLSWTHTPSGDGLIQGVVVFVVSNSGADGVTGATYGGTAMTEVSGSPNLHASGEPGSVYAYFLGSGLGSGAKVINVNVGNAISKRAGAYGVNAHGDTMIVDADATINSDSQANPSVTLSTGGKLCFAAIGFHSGQNAPGSTTPLTNWTSNLENDFGNQVGGWYRFNSFLSADVTAGWTQTADDATMIGVLIGEADGGHDTLVRMGSMALTNGSGLITADFSPTGGAAAAAGGMLMQYYANLVQELR